KRKSADKGAPIEITDAEKASCFIEAYIKHEQKKVQHRKEQEQEQAAEAAKKKVEEKALIARYSEGVENGESICREYEVSLRQAREKRGDDAYLRYLLGQQQELSQKLETERKQAEKALGLRKQRGM